MPKANPQEGEYWSKQLFRIGDGTPHNILELKDDDPTVSNRREIYVERINDERLPTGKAMDVSVHDFRSRLIASGEDNIFFRAQDTVFVDGRNGNSVVFHNVDDRGNPTGPKQMIKKDQFLMDYQFYGGPHPRYKAGTTTP